eukprot:m.6619 g.6619  ORF g.6619 m.6619 type:complete len:178 (+) comp3559_c0_seq2:238-771(+)
MSNLQRRVWIVIAVCIGVAAWMWSKPEPPDPFFDVSTPRKPAPDLPVDAKLRIGTLKRIESCDMKTRHGDVLVIHYTGWTRSDGQIFDSSVRRGDPFEFPLGQGVVIKGWEEGLLYMCVGERRRLTVPAALSVASMVGLEIDESSTRTLVYDIELLKIKRQEQQEPVPVVNQIRSSD